MRGTPCTCCSRSQQRSGLGLRLRLTALLVLIERVWWTSHPLSTSSALDIWQKHISHICGRRSCRPVRYLSSSTHSHLSEQSLAKALRLSSSITTGHYVLNKDVDPKRLGSENNAMKEAQQAHTKWHRWCRCSSTCSSKLYLCFSWNACFAFVGDPSYSLVLDWRRSKSTRRSIHMNEPK